MPPCAVVACDTDQWCPDIYEKVDKIANRLHNLSEIIVYRFNVSKN